MSETQTEEQRIQATAEQLAAEQLAGEKIANAREEKRQAFEKEMEEKRHLNTMAITEAQKETQLAAIAANAKTNSDYQAKQIRLESVRLAKETLIENARSKPVDSRDISAEDIQNYAKTIESYING